MKRNFLLPLLLLMISSANADSIFGKVVGVSDGDTITVLDADQTQHKIRVSGIDAPEKAQPFGQRSKESMSSLVFGKEVEVIGNKRDRYRRLVAKVMVAESSCQSNQCPKTLDAGIAQITMGLAWWYRKYAREQSTGDAQRYELAEQDARARRVGLWADAAPMPPWDWRRSARP